MTSRLQSPLSGILSGIAGPTSPLTRVAPGSWSSVRRRFWNAIASAAVVTTAWFLLAPPQIGGSTSFVIASGTSMLPKYHAGDLVLLRSEDGYHVGEVTAYHNEQLRRTVMHRIVAIDGDHYVFKGDNNNFVDSFEPTRSQIIGREWIHLPGAGRYVVKLHTPAVAAAALGALWLVSFSRTKTSRRQRRRHRHAT